MLVNSKVSLAAILVLASVGSATSADDRNLSNGNQRGLQGNRIGAVSVRHYNGRLNNPAGVQQGPSLSSAPKDPASQARSSNAVVTPSFTTVAEAYPDGVEEAEGANAAAAVTSCPADINGDGEANMYDFADFVASFAMGDEIADFDGDGFITGMDFDELVIALETGCDSEA